MKPQRPHLLICNLAISKSFIKTTPECVAGGAIISANVDFRICIYLKCKIVNYHSCARIFVEKGLCDIILILANMSQHVLLDKLSENSLFVYV